MNFEPADKFTDSLEGSMNADHEEAAEFAREKFEFMLISHDVKRKGIVLIYSEDELDLLCHTSKY